MLEFGKFAFEIILGVFAVVAGTYLLSFGLGLMQFMTRREHIARFVAGMDSGIYIEHGMTIDPETGLVTPQQRPSTQAYRHLL